MRPADAILIRLRREVEHELLSLRKLQEEHRDVSVNSTGTLQVRGRASILHDFYTGVERILVRIAEELNGGVPRSEHWHRQLLTDMTLELPGIRPALVSSDLSNDLGEFLRFRHLFRNLYGFVLDADRISELEKKLDSVTDRFVAEAELFLDWLTGPS